MVLGVSSLSLLTAWSPVWGRNGLREYASAWQESQLVIDKLGYGTCWT
jgi:hypothetical protein